MLPRGSSQGDAQPRRPTGTLPASRGFSVVTCVNESDEICVPEWVEDLTSFRRWAASDAVPDKARVCYRKGEVWLDMSREQLFSHNRVKTKCTSTLDRLAEEDELGFYFSDGILLSNLSADLARQPDGVFVSAASLRFCRVRLIGGPEGGFVELEGTPDMALEIVSKSSVRKDTVELLQDYWEAGIQEYWLIDARGDRVRFDIYRRTSRGYIATRKQAGWLRSEVFGKSFRLRRLLGPEDLPDFRLEARS
jgi:Uma2 family endonuclease